MNVNLLIAIFLKLLLALIIGLGSINALAQVSFSPNSQPAIPTEPENIAEAAGRYLGAADYLYFLKSTRCGYALTRSVSSFESVVNDEVVGYFPTAQRNMVLGQLLALKPEVNKQSKSLFDKLYTYYTKQENLDSKTACGFIVGSAITIKKMNAEVLQRKAGR